MKKCSRGKKNLFLNYIALLLMVLALTGCSGNTEEAHGAEEQNEQDVPGDGNRTAENSGDLTPNMSMDETGFAGESAADAQIDFPALKKENPDIFAWIYIPETTIDYPVLQSEQADDFYENHNAYAQDDDAGAIYIELANLTSMCDFNTVLHGRTGADGEGPFADLYRFADPDFFEEHENIYLYLEDNVLTYEIFAAYEREDTSLLRTYDFTYLEGCEKFLKDLYGTRELSMNLREGWEGVTPYHFLITLTTRREEADRQFVVVAILTQDVAGTIDRIVAE